MKAMENMAHAAEMRKAGQLTSYTNNLVQKELFDDNPHSENTIEFD